MIKLLDDFHVVWRIREPDKCKLSRAVHMTSSLVDIPEGIPAIIRPTDMNHVHRPVIIPGSGKQCRGGIGVDEIKGIMRKALQLCRLPYLQTMTSQSLNVNPSRIRSSVQNLRLVI